MRPVKGPVVAVATVIAAAGVLSFPALMFTGHGRHHLDWAARTADAVLGIVWVFFVWAVLGNLLRLVLALGGVEDPTRSRVVMRFG